uniref:Ras GTPase-activating protein 1 n=1 Tax=Octopus bimaculoides TaxID=37653 RepID=A0A0L8H737_OCTBM
MAELKHTVDNSNCGLQQDEFDPFSADVERTEEQVDTALTSAPSEEEWYHGSLDRRTAEERLRKAGLVGSYLVRESQSKPGSYVLSYFGKTGLNHFRISYLCGDYYIGGRQFDSLSLLIGYYTRCSYLLKGEQLQEPVAPPEPVDDCRKVIAILPFSGMPDTDELSFEKGEIFIVRDVLDETYWTDDVLSSMCFHENLSKEDAVEKLRQAGNGSFLVRPSEHYPGDYSLFFLHDKTVIRFRIEKQGRQLFIGEIGKRLFSALQDVLNGSGPSLDSAKTKELYASLKRGTGANLLKKQWDRIDITGYLKKRQKTKKWKNMYFILNGTERQLRYFENERRSKPKGMIDLAFSSIYPVHDSFFGRPNCFQLIINAYNHMSVNYLCADSTDKAQHWIQSLKPYCVNIQTPKPNHLSEALKELRSLSIEIFDGRDLPNKHLPHPYCVVYLNNVQVCRTQVGKCPNPYWGEDFILDDIPSDVESFTISIVNQGRRSKDVEVVQTTIDLNDLKSGEFIDEWYSLQPVNIASRGDMGSLRIKSRYLHEVIMPPGEYTTLKELILTNLDNVLMLAQVCVSERISLAKALLMVFRHENQESRLLEALNNMEIKKEDEVSTLFRATSLATTLMDQYMKMTASTFVQKASKDAVHTIIESKQSCELDPARMENCAELEGNVEHFLILLNGAVDDIFNSTEYCPLMLRHICYCLQRSAKNKWPDDESVRTRVVSGFIFLRLLCPAILNPKSFNLISETPTEMAIRSLKLVAKSLQNLANLVEFGAKEPYMKVVNPFIKMNKERMITFLDTLSNVPECPKTNQETPGDLARDMATIHTLCASHVAEIKLASETKPELKKLLAVTARLTAHKKCYMGES